MANWVKEVREFASVYYENDGWDIVQETWSDQDILDLTFRCRSAKGAVSKVREEIRPVFDMRAEAIAEGGEPAYAVDEQHPLIARF
jgi:hypothetical protein